MSGEVIGINTAIATTNARYQGYGFAVPVNILKTVAADLIKFGEVKRGYIGVQITTVDQTMANALGMKEAKGVMIRETGRRRRCRCRRPQGCCDVILEIDGREVNKNNELQSYIATRHPGDVVTLKVFRDGKTFDKKVTLRPRSAGRCRDEGQRREAEEPEATVEAAQERYVRRTRIHRPGHDRRGTEGPEDQRRVCLVSEVKPFGEAAERGIGKNDVILEADRKPVSTPGRAEEDHQRARKSGDSMLLRIKRDEQTAYLAIQVP